jgi:nucleotide-binding universal stress UspA family protein
MYRNLLVVTDGSVQAQRAVDVALRLANDFESELHLLFVQELSRFATTIGEVDAEKARADQRADFVISSAEGEASRLGVRLHPHIVVGGTVDQAIDCAIEHEVDLMVIASSPRHLVRRLLFGGTAERLAGSAPCSLHIVR